MRALVVGGSPESDAPRVRMLASTCDAVIAVDAGATTCVEAGVTPALVVGDMDSVELAMLDGLEIAGVEIVRYPADKAESDLELALAEVRSRGFDRVVLTGIAGGRADHALAALGTVARAADLYIVIDEAGLRGWALGRHGRRHLGLTGLGATVSVFALGRRERVRSRGLRWPLGGVRLESFGSRGLSNVIEHEPAHIDWRTGSLLVLSPQVGGVSPAREV